MSFPDRKYLENLVDHLTRKTRQTNKLEDLLLMLSGGSLNWVADFILDESVSWEKRDIKVSDLYLTGTNPEWNKIVIEKAERSPGKLKQLFDDPEVVELFKDLTFEETPILIRFEDGKYKVLDGMHRSIAAIRDNRETISAYVGTQSGTFKPMCESHVIYDLIKGYQRSGYKDREGLVSALRFLKNNYVNVESLLRDRFNSQWVPDQQVQSVIKEVL